MKNIESSTRQYQTVTPEFSSKLCFTYCCEVLRQRKHQLWLVYYCWWPISVTLISRQDLGELWAERPYPPWDSGQNEKRNGHHFCVSVFCGHMKASRIRGLSIAFKLLSLSHFALSAPVFLIHTKEMINFLTFYLFFFSALDFFFLWWHNRVLRYIRCNAVLYKFNS